MQCLINSGYNVLLRCKQKNPPFLQVHSGKPDKCFPLITRLWQADIFPLLALGCSYSFIPLIGLMLLLFNSKPRHRSKIQPLNNSYYSKHPCYSATVSAQKPLPQNTKNSRIKALSISRAHLSHIWTAQIILFWSVNFAPMSFAYYLG